MKLITIVYQDQQNKSNNTQDKIKRLVYEKVKLYHYSIENKPGNMINDFKSLVNNVSRSNNIDNNMEDTKKFKN